MGLLDNFGSKVGTYLGDKENLLNLASGFASMSGNPNTASIMAGIQGQRESLIKRRDAKAAQDLANTQTEGQRNATAEFLIGKGGEFAKIGQALKLQQITAKQAIEMAKEVTGRKPVDQFNILRPSEVAALNLDPKKTWQRNLADGRVYELSSQEDVANTVKVVGNSLVDSKGNVLFTYTDPSGDDTVALQTLKGRAEAAGLVAGTEAYQQFMIEGGAKKGMAFTSDGKGGFTLTQGGATAGKPKTEGQANATGFWNRVEIANKNLEGLEDQGTSFAGNVLASLPLGTGNWLQTSEFQLYSQSQEDWINAVLRDESGAAIGPAEFESAKTQYFPQVGDKPAVIAQKRANRKTKELGLWTKSGQDTTFPTGYSPSETTVTTRKRWNPNTRKLEEV